MSFYVRVFSQVEDFPSLYALCEELSEAEFEFATSPGKNEPEFEEENWHSFLIQYDEKQKPIELERNTKGEKESLLEGEVQEFIDALKEMPDSKGQSKAIELLKNTVQIYAFLVEDDITEAGWDFLECMLDFLCDATDGYVQVDEEGIYDKEGKLLVEME